MKVFQSGKRELRTFLPIQLQKDLLLQGQVKQRLHTSSTSTALASSSHQLVTAFKMMPLYIEICLKTSASLCLLSGCVMIVPDRHTTSTVGTDTIIAVRKMICTTKIGVGLSGVLFPHTRGTRWLVQLLT